MNSNKEKFWKLLEPEYEKAMIFCRKLMNNREKGDDLYQDSIVLAIRKLQQLRDQKSFRPWFYQIIMSGFKSSFRKSKLRQFVPFTQDTESSMSSDDPTEAQLAKVKLEKLLKVLSAYERGLIVLYELEGWTIGEIAELYKKTEGSIKLKLFRARNKLKTELKRLSKINAPVWSNVKDEYLKNYAL
ncbi:RNA polymerase sigma factor [Candidatus Zixiibacteriota bacterium]